MAIRFMWENRVDLTATVITAASANADLPVTNVAHPLRSKVYRTGTSAAAEWIKFDLGSAKTVQAVILLDHTLTAGDSSIRLQGGAAPGATTVDELITFNSGTMALYLSAVQTYQYWQVIFTKSAAGETRDIGRVFLGPLYEATRSFRFGSCEITPVDLSDTDRAIGGQTYSEIKSSYDTVKGDFGFIADAQNTQMRNLADSCGTHTPWFLCIDSTNKPYELLYYGKTTKLGTGKIEFINAGAYLWSTSLEFAEEL